jgi:uncharacterized protein YcfJ
MDTSMVKGLVIGGIATVALGAGAIGGWRTLAPPRHADVVAVKEVTDTVITPREVCEDVAVRRQAPVQDDHRVAGTVIGAVGGGLLGRQIGGGSGRTLATLAGAAAGGYAGNRVQKNLQERDTVTTMERRCKTVSERSQMIVGYDVTYRLAGKEGVVRTEYRPEKTLPVKDGRVVTTAPASAAEG